MRDVLIDVGRGFLEMKVDERRAQRRWAQVFEDEGRWEQILSSFIGFSGNYE